MDYITGCIITLNNGINLIPHHEADRPHKLWIDSDTLKSSYPISITMTSGFGRFCGCPRMLVFANSYLLGFIESMRVFLRVVFCPWLDFGLPPRCPQVVWCHWEKIEPFSAMLVQDRLAECDQPKKIPWTWATGRTDSELSHWAIITDFISHYKVKITVGYLWIIKLNQTREHHQ